MALLSSKKNTKAKAEKAVSAGAPAHFDEAHRILLQPRITEKASEKAMNENVYVFEVSSKATKREIAQAVFAVYKVKPLKVATITIPHKKVIVRGIRGVRAGGKKAYVYVKKGEKIEIV
jgi:large subunit ribosomal protein L23